jgi:excisionase family DNA binding protein
MTPSRVNAEEILGVLADLIAEKIKAHFDRPEVHQKRLFTVAEAAAYLGRTPTSVRHLIRRGELPRVQRGDNRVLLDRADLDQWIELGKTR